MPIIKQKNEITWYNGEGVHSLNVGCLNEDREQCTCQYHITDGVEQFSFEDYASAEKKWCELTADVPFKIGKTNWN